MDFDFRKAWFAFAKPAYNKLDQQLKHLVDIIYNEIRDIPQTKQNPDLNIPQSVFDLLKPYPDIVLAELSNILEFYYHWNPLPDLNIPYLWKVVKAIDQELSNRIKPSKRYFLANGILSAKAQISGCSFSRQLCHATRENYKALVENRTSIEEEDEQAFNNYCLQGEDYFRKQNTESGLFLSMTVTSDLIESADCPEYEAYLDMQRNLAVNQLRDEFSFNLKQNVMESVIQYAGFVLLLTAKIVSPSELNNVIYYSHEDCFTFGWRSLIPRKRADEITKALEAVPFPYQYKIRTES